MMWNRTDIPEDIFFILGALNAVGHEAYLVGGCVRDLLLGRQPKDWDVTTSAHPEEVKACFGSLPVLEIGLRHGTVGILLHEQVYEVTTFRAERGYADGRHPDEVRFVGSLSEDLLRRDFTVNAMAWHPDSGIVDPYAGQQDLEAGVIRCVGDARQRFSEDALRILRALRFAARYRWNIDPATSNALIDQRSALQHVSGERLREELCGILSGKGAVLMLREYAEVFCQFIPELRPMIGLDQRNPHHCYDVWEHTLHAVDAVDSNEVLLRLVMLFHDVGKPACFCVDDAGVGHCFGHAKAGSEMTRSILQRLRFDSHTIAKVADLVARHDWTVPASEKRMRRDLVHMGEGRMRQLLCIKRADVSAQTESLRRERLAQVDAAEKMLSEILRSRPVMTLRDLAINGSDLLELGLSPGPAVGRMLQTLLERTAEGRISNCRRELLHEAKRLSEESR